MAGQRRMFAFLHDICFNPPDKPSRALAIALASPEGRPAPSRLAATRMSKLCGVPRWPFPCVRRSTSASGEAAFRLQVSWACASWYAACAQAILATKTELHSGDNSSASDALSCRGAPSFILPAPRGPATQDLRSEHIIFMDARLVLGIVLRPRARPTQATFGAPLCQTKPFVRSRQIIVGTIRHGKPKIRPYAGGGPAAARGSGWWAAIVFVGGTTRSNVASARWRLGTR